MFKVIQNETVVDVGTVFLKWNINKHKFNLSSTDDGQFVQSYRENAIYRDEWMKPFPEEATGYQFAKVVIIAESEYNDLKDLLDNDETVKVEEVQEPVYEAHHLEEEKTEEKKLTLAEMRELIVRQQKQIEQLTALLNS